MSGPIVVVGWTPPMQKALEAFRPPGSVVFVDEPTVAAKRGAHAAVDKSETVRELIDWEYQLPTAADRFYLAHPDLAPSVVLPGVEYAVPFAARLAERYGVPGATAGAAELLRDKWALRQVATAAGIANPVSRQVASAAELRAVLESLGEPVVLKPANRQGAVGTMVLHDVSEVDDAWAACIQQDEGVFQPDREIPLRMLAEQYVEGDEFSVEMLVTGGRRIFANVTAKQLYPGPRPVEIGHTVPADIPAELTARLIDETLRTLAAVGFDTGFVHCEWIVRDGVLYLVECAGRMPGDGIIELIEKAYGYDIVGETFRMMAGEPMQPGPTEATAGAAVWFLHVEPGEVLSVDGVEEAAALPGTVTTFITVHPGDQVRPLRSSWDRIALVTAVAPTAQEALDIAQSAIGKIRVEVKPA